ncbi:MAG: hypothetical protein AAFP89_25560 [Bacteroidota bacterium]
MMKKRSKKILSQIQANIVKPHGRHHCWYLFFHFPKSEESYQPIRKAIVGFSSRLTSGLVQVEEALKRKEYDVEGQVVTCLFFSEYGLEKIVPESHLIKNLKHDITVPFKSAYPIDSFKDSKEELNLIKEKMGLRSERDPNWEAHHEDSNSRIDMVVMIADNHLETLTKYGDFVITYFKTVGTIQHLFTEKGKAIKRGDACYEPFGFRDGLSKIPFWEKKNEKLNYKALSIVLDSDLGSGVTFHKYRQDVAKFYEAINKITYELFFEGEPLLNRQAEFFERREYILAQFMGRFRDGTPLLYFDRPVMHTLEYDEHKKKLIENFNVYPLENPEDGGFLKDDKSGSKCPFFAHIRQSNPRDHLRDLQEYCGGVTELRIARRGIPFEEVMVNEEGKVEITQGLYFMSYQSKRCQFEDIEKWRKTITAEVPRMEPAIDPFVGRSMASSVKHSFDILKNWGSSEKEDKQTVELDISEFIKKRGEEYFYAPSLDWIKNLLHNHGKD